MGELEGIKGAWGYVEGGMGAVSNAVAKAAVGYGANIFTDIVSFNNHSHYYIQLYIYHPMHIR